jgi:hypothetical protein
LGGAGAATTRARQEEERVSEQMKMRTPWLLRNSEKFIISGTLFVGVLSSLWIVPWLYSELRFSILALIAVTILIFVGSLVFSALTWQLYRYPDANDESDRH